MSRDLGKLKKNVQALPEGFLDAGGKKGEILVLSWTGSVLRARQLGHLFIQT